jgi:Mor family transcriptional regulator
MKFFLRGDCVKTNDDVIEMLPGDLRRIAEVAGLEAAVRMAQTFGGTFIYVPGLDDMMRRARDAMIKKEYECGMGARKLARKHRLTERQIWNIVKNTGRETLPEELLDLLAGGQ